jgi:hypothetical protein
VSEKNAPRWLSCVPAGDGRWSTDRQKLAQATWPPDFRTMKRAPRRSR